MNRLTLPLLAALALTCTPAGLPQNESPAPAAANQKVIHDPDEYNAYIAALNTPDPAQKAAAMEAFIDRYPGSVVKVDALEQAMAAYQQAGRADNVEAVASRLLQLEPANIRALAVVAYLKRSRGTAAAAAEARVDAERGLAALPSWPKPDGMSGEDFAKLSQQMAAIFHGAAGFGALQAKDYAAAREHYQQSVQLDPGNLQDVYQLAIAELEMKPLDVDGFWYLARACHLAKGNPAAQKSIAGYGKAKYHRYHGGDDGWDQILAASAEQSDLPADFAQSIKPAPTPAEIAVKAVQESDPATLSFSDWEFVLALRDASPANREAADRIWQAIRKKQKDGTVKLKIPVVIISATNDTIEAAITDENQQAMKPDLRVTLDKPLAEPPAAGAKVDVIGVLTDYTPTPFLFIMEQGELGEASPTAAAPAR